MPRILGLGDNCVDIYADLGVQFPGGNTANVSAMARKLGAEVSYLGCVDDGLFGDLVKNALVKEGVDVSRTRTIDMLSSWTRIIHDGNDRVFDGSWIIPAGVYNLGEADYEFIRQHDLTHTSVYSRLEAELPKMSEAAPILSFDYSTEYDDAYLRRTAPFVDIAFLSDAKSSDETCHDLCRQVAGLGSSIVVITRGSRGAIGHAKAEPGHFVSQPIIPGDVVDTLGAGDGFIAGFIMAHLADQDMGEALFAGARNALAVCGYKGGFGESIPVVPGQPGLSRPEK